LPIGETGLAFYRAESRTKQDTVGTATFNVTPLKAGQYFAKTQCFCFTEQMLTAGESIQMPVSFYVDPAILEDPGMADVDTITLSYTFFRMDENGDAIQMDAAAADLDPFLTVN
jgi:cytochrome c oxidase assembly protein subunit 11